jgi:PAS domain S-box-containing protein
MRTVEPGLEKRIFSLYLGISITLISLLVIAEWQMGKYKIVQYENQYLDTGLKGMNEATDAAKNLVYAHIDSLLKQPQLLSAVRLQQEYQLRRMFETVRTDAGVTFIIIDKNQSIACCENWEPIKSSIADILSASKAGRGGFFYTMEMGRVYAIGFSELKQDNTHLGTLICTAPVLRTPDNPTEIVEFYTLFPIPDALQNQSDLLSVKLIDKINEQVRYSHESIIRVSSALAVGIKRLPGIQGQTGVVGLVLFYRGFNDFVQKGMLVIVMILVGISLMLIMIVGNWVSKTTLHPVKLLSKHMQKIQANPRLLLPFERSYHGVLGELITTFNAMNSALSDYSNSLLNYKVATENLDAGVFWLDQSWKITFCNPALASIFEAYDKYDVVGRQFSEFITLDNRTLKRALAGEVRIPNYVYKVDDSTKYLIINLRMIMEKDVQKIVGSIIDVTNELQEKKARESLEIELIRSNKLSEIGARVEGIVHNLNSPLNTILGYAQLLKKSYPENTDIDKIIDSGKVISQSVKSLFRKIQEGSVSMKQPVDVNKVIRQEIELLRHNLFFKHHVTLSQNLADQLPTIMAVSGDVSLCLANILNNAIQALADRPTKEIEIRTFLNGEMVAIEIQDTGIGIQESNFDVIFEPLYTTKKDKGGSGFGLGLAISKKIVDEVGGTIVVSSEPDVGSTFTICFPRYDEEQ